MITKQSLLKKTQKSGFGIYFCQHAREAFQSFREVFRSFGKFLEAFGRVRTHSDPFGAIGMHSGAFGSNGNRKFLRFFGFFNSSLMFPDIIFRKNVFK